MCFSPQRRAIFRHRDFQKWSEPVSFLTFWLANVLLATAACNFLTSRLPKVVRARQFFNILTCQCASRHSGVQFFDIATSKRGPSPSVFLIFWLWNVLLAKAACNFSTSQLQKVVRACSVLHILTSKCASRYSGVQFFMSPLNSSLRTRRFTEVTFRPMPPTNHWKTQHFATSLTFRAIVASFFWLYFRAIVSSFFWLYFSSLLFSSSDSATLLCFFNCPYCRKLDF